MMENERLGIDCDLLGVELALWQFFAQYLLLVFENSKIKEAR